jgi:hypothetical protein
MAAMTVLLTASLAAARVIWLITAEPEVLAVLAADNAWSLMTGILMRLLAII